MDLRTSQTRFGLHFDRRNHQVMEKYFYKENISNFASNNFVNVWLQLPPGAVQSVVVVQHRLAVWRPLYGFNEF